MSTTTSTPSQYFSSSEITRRAEHDACERSLIDALREVAFLASKLANDTPGLVERTRFSQMVARTDEELRRLCNKQRAA